MTLADENTTWNTTLLELLATQTTLQQTANYIMAREICRYQFTRAASLVNLRDGILIMTQPGQHPQGYFSTDIARSIKDNFKFNVLFVHQHSAQLPCICQQDDNQTVHLCLSVYLSVCLSLFVRARARARVCVCVCECVPITTTVCICSVFE